MSFRPDRRRLVRRWGWVLLVGLLGCDDSTGPEDDGLQLGVYIINLEVPAGAGAPEALVGRHTLRLRVDAPATQPVDFALEVTRHERVTATRDYLNPSPNGIVVSAGPQWRLQWRYRADPTLGVRITLRADGAAEDGRAILVCAGLRGEVEFPASSCDVDYGDPLDAT